MSIFIKEFIKQNLNQLTIHDILYYGKAYGFSLSKEQASAIHSLVNAKEIDPFQAQDREIFFKELAIITNPQYAQEAEQLLYQFAEQYNFQHLF